MIQMKDHVKLGESDLQKVIVERNVNQSLCL